MEVVGQTGRRPAGKLCIVATVSINGWYYPLLYQEHMDDPRSPRTLLKSDEDLARCMPLSAKTFKVHSLEGWLSVLRDEALVLQRASLDPRDHLGWRPRLRSFLKRRLGIALAPRQESSSV